MSMVSVGCSESPCVMHADILLSKEPPEPDYEYVNPVHVLLRDDDKDDEVSSTPSLSPPTTPRSWLVDTDDVNNTAAAGRLSPAPSHHAPVTVTLSNPILLPPIPTSGTFFNHAPTKSMKKPMTIALGVGLQRNQYCRILNVHEKNKIIYNCKNTYTDKRILK